MNRPGEVKESELGPGWKLMIVASFAMLSMLTWGMSPLQKLVEKVQHKETIRAQLKVCTEVRAMIPVYQDWVSKLWVSGCAWQTRNIMVSMTDDSKESQRIEEEFKNQEGLSFEKAINLCSQPAAEAMRENKIVDRVATPIYFEKFDCPKIYEEAKKLGIPEDENERNNE
jgi:hypothetical protein